MDKPMSMSELKRELKQLDNSELIELISNLYKANDQVKEMMQAKFVGEKYQVDALEAYKKKMYAEFFPHNMRKALSLKTAKALITAFKKVGSFEMVLDLMLYYVECGDAYTNAYGDIDGPFYDSLCSVYDQFIDQLNAKGTEVLYITFKDRIDRLMSSASNVGWGYGDFINDKSFELEWLLDEEGED